MILYFRAIQAEWIKLNRSLVWLLCAAPPAMMGVMMAGFMLNGNQPEEWLITATSGIAIWAYLLMPLTITALTALMASIEHSCGGWTWSLAQPVPKTSVFLAKASLTVIFMTMISFGVGAGVLLGAYLGTLISSEGALTGAIPLAYAALLLGKMVLASLLALALQFTISHAFRSFALPIVVGIGGTFVSVVATSWEMGAFFPWLMPVNMLASDPARAQQVLLTGSLGGLVMFIGASLWLARRDWR